MSMQNRKENVVKADSTLRRQSIARREIAAMQIIDEVILPIFETLESSRPGDDHNIRIFCTQGRVSWVHYDNTFYMEDDPFGLYGYHEEMIIAIKDVAKEYNIDAHIRKSNHFTAYILSRNVRK